MPSLSREKSIDFDRWAPTYEANRNQLFYSFIHRAVLSAASDALPLGSLLDVGCGTGRLLRAAGSRWSCATLIGVDPSPAMIEVARRLMPGAAFHIATAESLPLADASVDMVLSTVSFHHWKDQLAGLREIVRVLRPGGTFFLADVSPLTWFSLLLLRHPRSQTPGEVRTLFRKAGLQLRFQRFAVAGSVLITAGTRQAEGIEG